jgi:hypothetical protein
MKVRSKVSGLTVQARGFGRTLAEGDVIELDDPIVDDITWRDALGAHVDTDFEPVTDAADDFAPVEDDGAVEGA